MAFVGHYNVFPLRSRALLCVPGSSCVFPCVIYASELESVGHYLSSLWPWIGICCRWPNPLHSQCYNLESSYKWALECPIIYIVSMWMGIWMPYYLTAQHIYVTGTKNNLHPQYFCLSIVKWKLEKSVRQDIIIIGIVSLTIVHDRKAHIPFFDSSSTFLLLRMGPLPALPFSTVQKIQFSKG